jgi:starvation-inducible DNA-binding protein
MTQASVSYINIGVSDADRAEIAGQLSWLLADTYTLYLKTHNFHWNVTGPMCNTLQQMFMLQYTELWNAVDPIAERIRSLHPAPGSYAQFGKLASIADVPAEPPRAMDMVRILVDGHEAVVRTARGIFRAAKKAGDKPTADLLAQRLTVHEQTAWMLRSLLRDYCASLLSLGLPLGAGRAKPGMTVSPPPRRPEWTGKASPKTSAMGRPFFIQLGRACAVDIWTTWTTAPCDGPRRLR